MPVSIAGSSGLDQPSSLRLSGEGDRNAVSFRTTLQAGETRVVTITLDMTPRPPGRYTLDLVPESRVRATTVFVDFLSGYLVNEFGRQALFELPAYGGANCAVRMSTLHALGGWNPETVTEDTDLTLRGPRAARLRARNPPAHLLGTDRPHPLRHRLLPGRRDQ